ncbi:MAG: sigma-54 dependent transcriptional regulator [Polyangiaceae bacterium]
MPRRDEPQPKHGRVLVVDDEAAMAEMVVDGLVDRGYDAEAVASSVDAAERIAHEPLAAIVTDLRMPSVDGLDLLALVRRHQPEVPVIIMTAYGAIDSAVESMRLGAFHYLTKPFKLDELSAYLDRAMALARSKQEQADLRSLLRRGDSLGIVSRCEAMREAFAVIERVAPTAASVLLLGETGTGKSLFARALHAMSDRSAKPFVTINCAALPEALLESELFGHVKGAFTGAVRESGGLVEEADGGTLFLDEIAELAPALQAKLLDLVERRAARAVGSNKERRVDVRIVAATNRDLAERARAGAFREDLFYRLDVVSITLPPLRERREDLPDLIEHLLAVSLARHPASPVRRVSAAAMESLTAHTWPGNVRELGHTIERAVLLATGPEILPRDLPPIVRASRAPEVLSTPAEPTAAVVLPIREVQRRYAAWALQTLGGHRTRTAAMLGVDLKTLSKWLGESEREAAEPRLPMFTSGRPPSRSRG